MTKYYKPDSRWDSYGIQNKQDFVKRIVVEGHFHEGVPKHVVEAYTTVKYLIAHSYYFWPMFDEALNKLLLTIEMAVKLKAQELGIPITEKQKNGTDWDIRLSTIIDEICRPNFMNDLKSKLERGAHLRNMSFHPKQNSYSGPMAGKDKNIKYCINVVNRLFKNKEWHKKQQKLINVVEVEFSNLQNQLLIVESSNAENLISTILDFDIVNQTLFAVCLPVLEISKNKHLDNSFPRAIYFVIEDFSILNNQIIGKTIQGNEISISVTERDDLHEAFKNYQKYISSFSELDKLSFASFTKSDAPWQLVEAEYQYSCEAYSSIG